MVPHLGGCTLYRRMVKVMKIGGWRDIKTVQVYLRLSGVDEAGATNGLRLLISR
jgi:hypothetical protein